MYSNRLFLLLLACVTSIFSVLAEPITQEQARQKAERYLAKRSGSRKLAAVVNKKKLSPIRATSTQQEATYYAFNRGDNEGFVLVAADDRVEGVLGYTDEGEFDYNEIPDNMRSWLDAQERQIQYLLANPGIATADVPTHPAIAEMLTTRWNQNAPYNDLTPRKSNGAATATGCVATAMAQVLYFQRAKSVDAVQADIPGYTTWTQKIQVEGIPEGSPIDWKNMLDTYGSGATGVQKTAVAQLMKYCGVAVQMDYDDSSGAQPMDVPGALNTYFGYSTARIVYQYDYDATGWDALLYSELAEGRVAYLGGYNSKAGHAFVCDGYDGAGCFHINWGWGGSSNGFYKLTALTPGQQGIGGSEDGSGYTDGQNAVIGCEPTDYSTKELVISNTIAKKICLENWDTDKNGKFTYGEAAAVTDLGEAFKGKRVATFEELYYFTGLTTIADDAFNGCTTLTTIKFPKKLKKIGERAFKGCSKLKTMTLPDMLVSIGDSAFYGCKVLPNQTIPTSVTQIGASAFQNCLAFTTVELPFAVTVLGDEAFAGCTKLTSVIVRNPRPQTMTVGTSLFKDIELSAATLSVIQGTRDYYENNEQWQGFGKIIELHHLSRGNFVTMETNKDYYLYHIGTGRFLTKGEAYSTQAVVGDEPMRFQVRRSASMAEGVYYLYTNDNDDTSRHWLFRTSTDPRIGDGIRACFVDGTSLTASAYWTIEPIGDNLYTIQVPSSQSEYVVGQYFGVQLDHANNYKSPTYGLFSDVPYVVSPLNCQWAFVPYDADELARFEAAEVLGKLLATAVKKRLSVAKEQAVYDNIQSTVAEIEEAEYTLRQKLGYINFADKAMRTIAVNLWDQDSDGELTSSELARVTDVGITFQNNTSVKSLEDLQYFTGLTTIAANSFQGCTQVTKAILPATLEVIENYGFQKCSKLESVELPVGVKRLGVQAFANCSKLKSVTVAAADPADIALGTTAFTASYVADATLYVPFGSKDLYAGAAQWKNFGTIIETRTRVKPAYSPVEPDVPGYIYHIKTGRYLSKGEAYGTQSVVSTNALLYQFKAVSGKTDVYGLVTDGKYVFRTTTDSKVGTGVKACFYDGSSFDSKAYWQYAPAEGAAENVFTLQVPATDGTYVEGNYLGVQTDHYSEYTSPTNGVYWDITSGADCQWAFISAASVEAVAAFNALGDELKLLLAKADAQELDVAAERAVYDNVAATDEELEGALSSVKRKLGFITFADSRAERICLNEWDRDHDGYFSLEEAAAVTDLGSTFHSVTGLKGIDELRYFAALTELPAETFMSSAALVSVYVPAGVKSIGADAFKNCSALKYLALLSETGVVDASAVSLPKNLTIFVPAALVEAYQADPAWGQTTILEFTDIPTITAGDAERLYGASNPSFTYTVTGAPVNGVPTLTCDADIKSSVGDYAITPNRGPITTIGLELIPGTLAIGKAMLKITARNATREMGQENPEFQVRYSGWKNNDKETCLLALPVASCEADIDSPAGEYEITVSGAEAENYEFNYVSGTLTVTVPVGIESISSDKIIGSKPVYDLFGRRVSNPQRGLYIIDGKKVLVKSEK